MRKGFTMIELIFVIVILGILAAVAIPKLTATRDDAQVAKGASEIATAVQDMGAYYTAKGSMSTTLSDMTNVSFSNNSADMNSTSTSVTYSDCITVSPTSSTSGAADGVNVSYTHSGASSVCQGIAAAADQVTGVDPDSLADANKTHTFGGSGVSF